MTKKLLSPVAGVGSNSFPILSTRIHVTIMLPKIDVRIKLPQVNFQDIFNWFWSLHEKGFGDPKVQFVNTGVRSKAGYLMKIFKLFAPRAKKTQDIL